MERGHAVGLEEKICLLFKKGLDNGDDVCSNSK
jgi:hypothetical protein